MKCKYNKPMCDGTQEEGFFHCGGCMGDIFVKQYTRCGKRIDELRAQGKSNEEIRELMRDFK